MSFQITFPDPNGNEGQETFKTSNNIVLIGANGSGKSRLGVWIEEKLQEDTTVHRISAQKALNIPDYAEVKNLEQAEKGLLLGKELKDIKVQQKRAYRWKGEPATHLLNDYEKYSLYYSLKKGKEIGSTLKIREN